jgi:hypothetical protein
MERVMSRTPVERLQESLSELIAFVSIMCGRGADAVIPETVTAPLGVPVKIGAIMREAKAALEAIPRTPAVEVERLTKVLSDIERGMLPGLTDLALEGRWHDAFTLMQTTARAAISAMVTEP